MLNIMLMVQNEFGVGRPVDDELITEIASGSKAALHTLFESVSGNVYGFALSITKNKHDADDVLQETFLKVYKNAADYKPCGKPMAWVFTIAKNAAYSKLRESARLHELDESRQEELDFSAIENAEQKLVIEALFKILTDEEKQIVILHAVNGMKHREIAQVLKMPTGTVLSKYNRAIKKLSEQAKKEELL